LHPNRDKVRYTRFKSPLLRLNSKHHSNMKFI
jgi:hypothetical protein